MFIVVSQDLESVVLEMRIAGILPANTYLYRF